MKNLIQKYLPIAFDTKLFLFLVLGFIVATVVGTMSFGFGQYLVGESQGHEMRIHYAGAFKTDDRAGSFWLSISGMMSPILIGTIGLILLFVFRKKFETARLNFSQWVLVFISLFIMRQLDNFCFGVFNYLVTGEIHYRSAEYSIAAQLNLPSQSIQIFMVIVGLIVLVIIFFRFIPRIQRLTFLIAGPVGALAGYYLWLIEFGKKILP